MDRPPWWTGEDSWLPKHSLLCGGCKDSIDEFWLKSGKDPTSKRVLPWQHQSPPMLDVRMGQQNSASELSQSSYNKERPQMGQRPLTPQNKSPDPERETRSTATTSPAGQLWKRSSKKLLVLCIPGIHPTTRQMVTRCLTWESESQWQNRDSTSYDTFCNRRIWSWDGLWIRLYIAGCWSILVYGSEVWLRDTTTCKVINGSNSYMLSHITGKSHKDQTTASTFNIILWVRVRRKWYLGHIVRKLRILGMYREVPRKLIKHLLILFFVSTHQLYIYVSTNHCQYLEEL